MSNTRTVFITALAVISLSAPVSAAPFCVQTQALAPECVYVDATQCRQRAAELGGYCVANPAELVIRKGGTGRYCLVLSSRQAECVYADRDACQRDAGPANGVCIEQSAAVIQQDPYRLDINRDY